MADQQDSVSLAPGPGGSNDDYNKAYWGDPRAERVSQPIGTKQRSWINRATGEEVAEPATPLMGHSIPRSRF